MEYKFLNGSIISVEAALNHKDNKDYSVVTVTEKGPHELYILLKKNEEPIAPEPEKGFFAKLFGKK